MPAVGRIKIRMPHTISRGQVVPVDVLVTHPMETGLRKTKDGKVIPAYFINGVDIFYGGDRITHCDWTIAVSANPFMTFYLKADKAAPLRIVYKDNKGGVYQETVQINPR
ncbi:MAG: thiosulfate oxidation carrier complex protein SoxZ [Nitrospiraceae bacterium]|nr:thiosulfate oxidation carrier complex protein SoxZ [Nitrospiraceae bacterium]